MAKPRAARKSREAPRPAAQSVAAEKCPERAAHAWRTHAWRLSAIFGLLLLAYSNSFQAGLLFDDVSIVAHDPRIREATPQNIAAILSGSYRYSNPGAALYRPLTTLTYLLNYGVFGNRDHPAAYHCVNFALHAMNVALVYALGIAIFGETAPAWALAAIWGLHPVLTESVTNIVGRADLLAAFGVLAGLLCYLKANATQGRHRRAWLAGAAAAQAIGIFSKENALVLPAIVLLYELIWRRSNSWRRRAPAYIALALPIAAFFYLRSHLHLHLVIPPADNPLVIAGFWQSRLTALEVIGKLLWLFLWPARLSADYSYNAIPVFGQSAPSASALPAVAAALGAALLVFLLAARHRNTQRPSLFFLAFFFVAALPTSNLLIFIGSIMAERFLYLPAIGLSGFAIAATYTLAQRHARVARPLLALICLALAARTFARNRDWKDESSLWTSAVAVSPGSAKAHYNLAKVLETQPARLSDVIAEYHTSLQIDPEQADVHNNLAGALFAIPGHLSEAIAEYRVAIRLQPDRAEPHNNLANALAQLPGRLPEAIAEFQSALRISPDNAEVHYNLANALLRMPGRTTNAIDEYRAALTIDPDHADAHINLANALARLSGRLPEAIHEYRAALALEPDSAAAHIGLANALTLTPDGLSEAIAEYRKAIQLRPNDAEAHYDLGVALTRVPGRLSDSILEFQSAVRSAPEFFEARVNLGNALAQTPGRLSDAIAEYESALRIKPDPVVQRMLEEIRAGRRVNTH